MPPSCSEPVAQLAVRTTLSGLRPGPFASVAAWPQTGPEALGASRNESGCAPRSLP